MNLSKALVDRQSPVPAYQQIASSLIDRIVHEEWSVGDKLPSENELAQQYNVSRVTLRQALSVLDDDGIIVKRQGKGVFIQENPNLFVQELRFPTVDNHGKALQKSEIVSKRVQIRQELNAPRNVYLQLEIPIGAPLIHLQRLFAKGTKLLGVNRVWFPAECVPELEQKGLVKSSISTTLSERYGYEIVRIRNLIESIKLDAAAAQLLQASYDAAALKIDSVHVLNSGKPIEFSSTIWVGDCTRFHLEVTK